MTTLSPHYQIAEAVQTRLVAEIGLGNLPNVEAEAVVILKDEAPFTKRYAPSYPAILIKPVADRPQSGGTNVQDRVDYVIEMMLVANERADGNSDELKGTQKQRTDFDTRLNERRLIAGFFRNQRLTIADSWTDVYSCEWEQTILFDRQAWVGANLWKSPVRLRFNAKEVRNDRRA